MGFQMSHSHNIKPSLVLATTESHPVSYYIEAPAVKFYQSGIITTTEDIIIDLILL